MMIKHGMWKSKEWNSWMRMKQRCYNENDPKYPIYGQRGISVCDRWSDKQNGFQNFLADMGYAPSRTHTIDREDVNGNYCKSNCRWATPKEQANNRRNAASITYNGDRKSIKEWAKILNTTEMVLKKRVQRWGVKKTIETPVKKRNHSKTPILFNK